MPDVENNIKSTQNAQPTTNTPVQSTDNSQQTTDNSQQTTDNSQQTTDNKQPKTDNSPKISALSLSSIRAKKELEAKQAQHQRHQEELPTESFTETDMRLIWNKFAQRLTDQGKRLMATYMQMNDPVLNGATITLELPNQSTREEFLTGYHDLLGYLRGKLHNHDITIEVHVNETTETKYAFTPIQKYEKLKSINPNIELLKKLFDLDV